jgi:hypothetical protein
MLSTDVRVKKKIDGFFAFPFIAGTLSFFIESVYQKCVVCFALLATRAARS